MEIINRREAKTHSSELVPYSYYESRIPDYFPGVPLHWHQELEINYIRSGSGEFICGGRRFISEPGDIIVIAPEVLHAVYRTENKSHRYDTLVVNMDMLGASQNDRCSLDFFKPLLSGRLTIHPRITESHDRYEELKSCAENIFIYARKNGVPSDFMLKAELLRLLAILAENGDIYLTDERHPDRIETIRPALEYISKHFTETVTIDDLAELSHLSKSYFMSSFKKSTGIGAIEYMNHLRIKRARELLLCSEKNISEIAYACGFTNLANFNRQFLKQNGISPRQYRKLNKNTISSLQ
ncbi:MAG: AraC family transcriptional regulator [Oscillibacter sp.]|nr:AraC family transcriptional regulator [Oscillibacter sp.]